VAKERYEDRQRRKAAAREAGEQKARRASLIWRAVGVVVVVIAIAVSYSFVSRSRLLQRVTTATYRAGMHVAGPIAYTEKPPMGGAHNVVWQNCGVYEAPIHSEHAVHALEHGAVWITYRPGLAPEQVQTLKAVAADDFLLLSPYPGLEHAVVASAWNHQLTFDRADESGLRAFIARFKNNPETTPEFGAPCAGGTSALATVDSLNTLPGATAR
jgi:hypothetical protein